MSVVQDEPDVIPPEPFTAGERALDYLIPRDTEGEPWDFAHIPWISCLDEDGKSAKIPARREWQLTEAGSWQVPDLVTDPDMPDEEDPTGFKMRLQPGPGAWREDWEEGWVTNSRTGLWVVDIDDPEVFWALMKALGMAPPQTRAQSTGRAGGGLHLLFDGRGLPEEHWNQGGLGDPCWGDLKANGWVAAEGSRHPTGRRYARAWDWPDQILPPPLWWAGWIMEQREKWRASLSEPGRARTGRPNVSSAEGENRNVRLCRLRGILFNKVPELDDDEIAEALWAANEEFATPLTDREMLDTVLRPKPDWERHPQQELVMPTVRTAVRAFEQLYDLRACGEEFFARPADPGMPAVVTEIGDAMRRRVNNWWRRAAEAWNAEQMRGRSEATEAFREQLEARDPLEQLEILKELYFERQKKKDEDEDYEGKQAEDFPSMERFNLVVENLRTTAATEHEPVELHLRVTDGPGRVVVDLCDASGSVVLITADGWQVCDVREVEGVPWFRRGPAMLPQVVPVAPGDVLATLDEACQVLGLDAAQWRIGLGGVIGAYFPSIARPGPWFTGPSGTGKTTRARMLAGWIDPMPTLGGRINLRRDARDARAKAMNVFVFTIDNTSLISQDESDFWCQMHTGASDQVRKLHSDNTMLNFSYRRIGMGTSLVLPAGFQADALRRMLHIQLAGTDDHPDSEVLWRDYEAIKPQVLGAIFTVIAGVLANLDKAMEDTLAGVPEMSDFARRLHAADLAFPGLGGDDGLGPDEKPGLYEAYRRHAFDILVTAGLEDPLALLVIKLMDKHGEAYTALPSELLAELRTAAGGDIGEKWFPADATRMGEKLVKLDGPLRRLGIVVSRGKHTKHGTPYVITKAEGDAGDAEGDAVQGVSIT